MRDGPVYTVSVLPAARRQLLALRGAALDHIRRAIRALADDPAPPDSLAMTGKALGLRRLRIGVWRIVYRVRDDELIVLVVRVGHRADRYRGLEPRRQRP